MKKDGLEDKYKERLKKIAAKKIDTTMIHALSQFEVAFGEVFGFGLPNDRLDDEERIYSKKWTEVRQRILDNGNRQKRNLMTEIDQYDVHWNRYQSVLVPINKEEN